MLGDGKCDDMEMLPLGRPYLQLCSFCESGKEVLLMGITSRWEGLWEHAVTAGGTFQAYMLVPDDDE